MTVQEASITDITLSATTKKNIRADAEWILRSQTADGAIATAPDHSHVRPYLANYAALGLAAAARATGDMRYAAAAWRWLHWYQAHQDSSGFVADYDRTADRRLVSTKDMDSTDAYAGTFLLAVRATGLVTQDRTQLDSLTSGVAGAVRAIHATQQPDGLTWAKPKCQVKYLMDQAEAYAGLRAAADMAATFGMNGVAPSAATDAAALSAGVARLWNGSTGSYDWAKHLDGAQTHTVWTNLYSDALQQPWAVAFGLVAPGTATSLMARFDRAHPNWDAPNSMALVNDRQRHVGYWAPVGWAYLRTGDRARAATAVSRIRSAAVASGRAWPFTPADAGQLIILQTESMDMITP